MEVMQGFQKRNRHALGKFEYVLSEYLKVTSLFHKSNKTDINELYVCLPNYFSRVSNLAPCVGAPFQGVWYTHDNCLLWAIIRDCCDIDFHLLMI